MNPRHIILSRKGFDSSAGGWASPIIGKTLVSFPIPNLNNYIPAVPISYEELFFNDISYASLLSNLTDGQFDRKTCHLDPDINEDVYKPRPAAWKPLFGPEKGKYTHLMDHGVGIGDLILFFGWFKHTELLDGKYTYIKDPEYPSGMHVIFGYMEIGDIRAAEEMPAWAKYHPHVSEPERQGEHLFIAKKAEVFPFSKKLILTKLNQTPSRWKFPFLKDIDMSWNPHKEKRWNKKKQYFQTVGRGQEFVLEAKLEVMTWVKTLII